MENNDNLKKHVIEEFSSENAQKIYIDNAQKGLWKAEKILIEKYFKPSSTVLDIGCGTGRTTIPLYKMGCRVRCIDITPKMIENAQKIADSLGLDIPYEIGDATNLRFANDSIDNALFSNNGWDQIPGQDNRLKALKEIFRVLKPGGIYIFTSHIRKMNYRFFGFWVWQWLKINILKPLNLSVREVDFGDRFFKRATSSGETYKTVQYIHIPSLKEVQAQLKKAEFSIVYQKTRNQIAKDDNSHTSPMFFVCQKP